MTATGTVTRTAPGSGPPAIVTRGLEKVFRGAWGRPPVHALKPLELEVVPGEIFGLLGPNGSGKSTTIKLLLGLLHPTRGHALVLGRPPRDVAVKARLGYVPEESYLHAHLTASETLAFHGRLFGLPRRELRERVPRLLELAGLAGARDRPVGELSKGMLRRITLAQALVNDPDLLILDEPTAGMDPIGTREVKDLLRGLKGRGKTVLLSSHLLADVEDVCDRVAILHEGELRALGSVESLLADDRRTQVVTGRLSPATVEALTALLREREGPGLEVRVGPPSTRLEELFLRVVSQGGAGKAAGEAP
ncbi:MAG: ABC transporter ATP-binding protein [Planctomycetes bacterium]|nr:ABC transporter ATP-binding protein [Planctomycetota bacterium]